MSKDVPSLCAWQATVPIPSPRTYHASVVASSRVYVAGGYRKNGSTYEYLDSVISIDTDSLHTGKGAWRNETSFAAGRSGLGMTVSGQCVVIAGGSSVSQNGVVYNNDVQVARIGKDGVLSAWTRSREKLQTPRSNLTLVSAHVGPQTFLYAVAGVTQVDVDTVHLDTVEVATIDDSCNIGPWQLANFHIHGGRSSPQAAVVHGRLLVLGGWGDVDLEDIYDDMQVSELRTSGQPSAWHTLPGHLSTGTYGSAVLTKDVDATTELLLLVGGQAGTGAYEHWVSIAYADPLLRRVDRWRIAPNGQLPFGRVGHTAHLIDGEIYVIGGSMLKVTDTETQAVYLQDVQRTTLDPGQE